MLGVTYKPFMLNVTYKFFMLNVAMLSVVMLSVMAPIEHLMALQHMGMFQAILANIRLA